MPTLFLYLLQTSGCMTILYLFYIACFKKETFYRYNRILLLSAFICSAIFPLIPIPVLHSVPAPDSPNTTVYFNTTPSAQVHTSVHPFAVAHPWWEPLVPYAITGMLVIYIGVALILLLVHLRQILKIRQLAKAGQVYTQNNIRYIQLAGLTAPFSFLRTVFFDANAHEPTELQHILRHEEAHVQQRHSIDILLSSLYCCICWINPFAWLCKKSLQLNLEFLADEAALQSFDRSTAYQYSLIKMGAQRGPVAIVNHFSKSFIKNRILMMNKTQSPRNRTWRYLLLLPALGLSAGLLSATAPVVTGRESGADKYLVIENNMVHGMVTRLTTDQDLADMKTALRAKGISTSYTRLKRNAAGEITYINFQAKNDHSGLDEESYTSPITTFFFYFGKDSTGVSISAIGETPMDITPKRLINRAVAESNGWMRGVTTDSTFRSRFPGGEDAYRKHLSKYIRYPRVCQENDIVGDVLIQYKIEPNGTITDVEVLKTPHQALGEEVKRVVSTFPSFKADPAGKTQLVTLCAGYMLESASGKVLEGEHDQTPDIQIIGYAVKK